MHWQGHQYLTSVPKVINSDDRIGWGGFLPFWYKSMHIIHVFTSLHIRQSLWDFFRAAFPAVTYCLASATLTDDAVKDIQSMPKI